jgi:hypothetical protein
MKYNLRKVLAVVTTFSLTFSIPVYAGPGGRFLVDFPARDRAEVDRNNVEIAQERAEIAREREALNIQYENLRNREPVDPEVMAVINGMDDARDLRNQRAIARAEREAPYDEALLAHMRETAVPDTEDEEILREREGDFQDAAEVNRERIAEVRIRENRRNGIAPDPEDVAIVNGIPAAFHLRAERRRIRHERAMVRIIRENERNEAWLIRNNMAMPQLPDPILAPLNRGDVNEIVADVVRREGLAAAQQEEAPAQPEAAAEIVQVQADPVPVPQAQPVQQAQAVEPQVEPVIPVEPVLPNQPLVPVVLADDQIEPAVPVAAEEDDAPQAAMQEREDIAVLRDVVPVVDVDAVDVTINGALAEDVAADAVPVAQPEVIPPPVIDLAPQEDPVVQNQPQVPAAEEAARKLRRRLRNRASRFAAHRAAEARGEAVIKHDENGANPRLIFINLGDFPFHRGLFYMQMHIDQMAILMYNGVRLTERQVFAQRDYWPEDMAGMLTVDYPNLAGMQEYLLRRFITAVSPDELDIFMAIAGNLVIAAGPANRQAGATREQNIANQDLARVEIARARQVVLNYPRLQFDDNPWPNRVRVLRRERDFNLFEAERLDYRRYLILPVEEVMAIARRDARWHWNEAERARAYRQHELIRMALHARGELLHEEAVRVMWLPPIWVRHRNMLAICFLLGAVAVPIMFDRPF